MSEFQQLMVWEMIADGLARGVFGRNELAWLDRRVRNPEEVADWITSRSEWGGADSEEVKRIVDAKAIRNVRESEVWRSLLDLGFQRTWERFRHNEVIGKQIATVVYCPELLSDIVRFRRLQ